MPRIELIRFDNPDKFVYLHHLYHSGRIEFLECERADGSLWRGDILACHPELCGFSVLIN